MNVRRRALFAQTLLTGLIGLLLGRRDEAHAENITYEYDALGRLRRVVSSEGGTIEYRYDAAGNRLEVDQTPSPPLPPPPPPPVFNQTINVTGPGPVNLRDLADAAGFNGAQNATVIFQVNSGTAILGAGGAPNGGAAVDTGTWPTEDPSTFPPTPLTINLTLVVKTGGKVYGGGGKGGAGNFALAAGAGGVGGDAVYCRRAISIAVESGGEIRTGGGGGGGGGGYWTEIIPTFTGYGGGGGGGGAPNGPGGLGANGTVANGVAGSPGTTSGGGAGGQGGVGGPTGRGGAGGSFGAAGAAGNSQSTAGGAGGAPGYAIRKNGNTVPVTNNGAITGTVG